MTDTLTSISAAADALAASLKTYLAAQPAAPVATPPVVTYASQLVPPDRQATITLPTGAPATSFSWTSMPWIYSFITGFRPGTDRLDAASLIPNYTGTDPVKDGYLVVTSSPDNLGTLVRVDVDGVGGNWPTNLVVLNGVLPWTVPGNTLFSGVLPPSSQPLDLSRLTLNTAASDEFAGADVDWTRWKSIWNYVDPATSGCNLPSNGEAQWYVNHDYAGLSSLKPWYLKNGQLHLVGAALPASLKPLCGYANDKNNPFGSYAYYAGMLQNSKVCAQTYGYFEASVTMPKGRGLWPAFWLLPNDGSWPPELDIFEQLGADPSLFYFTKHWVDAAGAGQSEGHTVHTDTTVAHRIGLWWDANYLILYLDGNEVVRTTNTNLHKPMYVVVNLAIGGNWGGPPDPTTPFPSELVLDYVRVYTINP